MVDNATGVKRFKFDADFERTLIRLLTEPIRGTKNLEQMARERKKRAPAPSEKQIAYARGLGYKGDIPEYGWQLAKIIDELRGKKDIWSW